jgi:hypothetical protein
VNEHDRIADVNLNLNAQALAVLHLLADRDASDIKIDFTHTYAWYNGRERGVCLVVQPPHTRCEPCEGLHIAFAEHRNSDSIVVYTWFALHGGTEAPTPGQMPSSAWDEARHFKYGAAGEAANWIFDRIKRQSDRWTS